MDPQTRRAQCAWNTHQPVPTCPEPRVNFTFPFKDYRAGSISRVRNVINHFRHSQNLEEISNNLELHDQVQQHLATLGIWLCTRSNQLRSYRVGKTHRNQYQVTYNRCPCCQGSPPFVLLALIPDIWLGATETSKMAHPQQLARMTDR